MFENIIETCNKFNTAVEHKCNLTDEDIMILQYFDIDLAKSIIHDLDSHNAKCIANIILAHINE